MKINKSVMAMAGIILLSFAIGIYFYPQMPERMASHWNSRGQVDGYVSKFWGLFLLPLMSAGLSLLLVLVPKIDPLKTNVDKFKKHYFGFVILLLSFLLYVYLLTILWNLGIEFNMIQLMSPAFGILFYYLGILVEKAKRNWFIGIRTPWTLNNEKVWAKTHLIGGKLFKIAGIIAIIGIFFQRYAIFLILIPIILITLVTTVYSYLEYQREIKSDN
ncbi:MAG: DUF1648 domain-containing protein [Dehalococcoidales bacterium]|nr:DUF1648 domain-containing protein [Dehalococcoidales bacterium]